MPSGHVRTWRTSIANRRTSLANASGSSPIEHCSLDSYKPSHIGASPPSVHVTIDTEGRLGHAYRPESIAFPGSSRPMLGGNADRVGGTTDGLAAVGVLDWCQTGRRMERECPAGPVGGRVLSFQT